MSDIENRTTEKLDHFFRNNYFHGKLMTVKDFELEQNYFNSKRHLINRTINGVGLVRGIYVEDIDQRQDDTWEAILSEGMLIDENGNEIIVANKKSYKITAKNLPAVDHFGLYIKSKTEKREDVPTPISGTSCEESCQKNLIKENFELFFDQLSESPSVKFDLPKAGESKIENYSHEYYTLRDSQNSCIDCYEKEKPKVLLAVLQKDGAGKVTILEETQHQRQIVYDNTMIYDILQSHIADFQNPHNIDAARIGAISSINKISDPNLVFNSESLQFITNNNDPNLASNEIKVELKSQYFSVVTGEIEITEYSAEKYQFFGPVYFPTKYQTPPMITLGKSDHSVKENIVEYLEDYAPHFFSSSNIPIQENQINFKVLHVTNEKFSIAIENNSNSAGTSSLFLRYWIIPSTGDDLRTIRLPDTSQSTITIEPFYKISDQKIKVEVIDSKIPDENNTTKIKVESTLTKKQKDITAIRTHKELDQFTTEIVISDFTNLPGDVLRVTHGNEVKETKIEPAITINQNTFFDISEKFELMITDYSQRAKPSIDVTLRVGKRETNILAKNTGEEHQSKFSYGVSRIGKLDSEFENYDIFGRGRGIQAGYSISIGDNEKFVADNSAIVIPSFDYEPKDKIKSGKWDRDEDLIAFTIFDSTSISIESSVDILVSGVLSNGKETPPIKEHLLKGYIRNEENTREYGFRRAFLLGKWLDHKFDREISQVKTLKATYTYSRKRNDQNAKFTIERILHLPD